MTTKAKQKINNYWIKAGYPQGDLSPVVQTSSLKTFSERS